MYVQVRFDLDELLLLSEAQGHEISANELMSGSQLNDVAVSLGEVGGDPAIFP